MNAARALWASIQSGDPMTMVIFHRWAKRVWLLIAFIGIFTPLKDSVPVLFFISVYANYIGHWSTEQAATVEVKQDEAAQEAAED